MHSASKTMIGPALSSWFMPSSYFGAPVLSTEFTGRWRAKPGDPR
jgi:hypothetical protein